MIFNEPLYLYFKYYFRNVHFEFILFLCLDFYHDKPENQIARFEVCENEAETFWHKFFALTAVAFIVLSAILITTMIYYRYKVFYKKTKYLFIILNRYKFTLILNYFL